MRSITKNEGALDHGNRGPQTIKRDGEHKTIELNVISDLSLRSFVKLPVTFTMFPVT